MERDRFIPTKGEEIFKQPTITNITTIDPNEGVDPSPVANHEAKHMVLLIETGVGAKSGTIEATNEYDGMVEPEGWSAVAAIGPDADGDKGGISDRIQVLRRGHNLKVVGDIARKMLNGLRGKVRLVAGLLERKRTISGYEAVEIMKRDDDPMERIDYRTPFGRISSITTARSQRNSIVHGLGRAA